MFGLREPILSLNLFKIYINLKLIMPKVLSVAFIVDTLLLSHINLAFQSILNPNLYFHILK